MRKIAIILITIMLFMVMGCSNKDVIKHHYTYKGENEFWIARYSVNNTGTLTRKDNKLHYEGNSNHTLTVIFIDCFHLCHNLLGKYHKYNLTWLKID